MNKTKRIGLAAAVLLIMCTCSFPAFASYGDHAGPYGENDGIHGGNRLDPDSYPAADPGIKGWATAVIDSYRSSGITHGVPENVLGQPGGTYDVFSLGDGGWIIVTFDKPVANGPGYDIAVWENGFVSALGGEEGFLFAELMFVEVSTNGTDFSRFPCVSLISQILGGFDCLDPTYVHNLAGKHPNGNDGRDEGTPFDLEDLSDDGNVFNGLVDLNDIRYVRLVDVIGDGSTFDSLGNPVYDPYPTPFGTGGADVDAVGMLNYRIIFNLQASVTGGHGTVAPANGDYASGTVVTVTAVPDTGYRVKAWQETDSDASTALTNRVTMDSHRTVAVEFETMPAGNFTLSLVVDEGGAINVDPQSDNNQYASGTMVTLTATPNDGWSFERWEGNVNDTTQNSTTVRMDRDQSVKAVFVQNAAGEDDTTPSTSDSSHSGSSGGGLCFIASITTTTGIGVSWPLFALIGAGMLACVRKKEN
jgi:hypothetical protein